MSLTARKAGIVALTIGTIVLMAGTIVRLLNSKLPFFGQRRCGTRYTCEDWKKATHRTFAGTEVGAAVAATRSVEHINRASHPRQRTH